MYAGGDNIEQIGWFGENSQGKTRSVGIKRPNELDLYDMSGNVYEWYHDWYSGSYYETCAKKRFVKNSTGPETGEYRIFRGGSWNDDPLACRSAYRDSDWPDFWAFNVGFRVAVSSVWAAGE